MTFLKFPLHIVIALWVLNKISKKRFTVVDPVAELSSSAIVIQSISIMLPRNRLLSPIIDSYVAELEAESVRLRTLNVAVVGFIPKDE